jgi:hypothetical protein
VLLRCFSAVANMSMCYSMTIASSLGWVWTPLVSIHHPLLRISAPAGDVQKDKANTTSPRNVSLTLEDVALARASTSFDLSHQRFRGDVVSPRVLITTFASISYSTDPLFL